MTTALIQVENLEVHRYHRQLLHGINLTLSPREVITIIGPNGAGKSTLIKSIMGLIPIEAGWISLFGEPVKRHLKRVAYVPQRESVDWDFPVNVLDVVMMGRYGRLGLFRRPKAHDREVAWACLEKVHMTPYADRQIANLSGGQQQRVFLARALAQECDLYLMDEPFAGVDAATEASIIELLHALRADGKTILVVHHDLPTARNYFDMLMLLNMRLIDFGPTETMFTYEKLQKTYGGRLTILSEVADAVRQNHET